MKKPSGQDRTASEWNYIARATRRRRRILQSRILSCFIGNTVIHSCAKVEPSYEIKNAPRGCAARGKENIALRTARARRISQARFISLGYFPVTGVQKRCVLYTAGGVSSGMTMEKGITELDGRSICIDGDIGEVLAQL